MWRLRDILVVGLAVSGAAASNWFPGHKTGEYRFESLFLFNEKRVTEQV